MLSEIWWEHLAPKTMHRRLGEITRILADWTRTEYGRFWLKSALEPNGIIRLRPGQPIPVFHLCAFRNETPFILPFRKMRAGHRSIGTSDRFRSAIPLGPDEIAVVPEIRFEIVSDPLIISTIKRGGYKIDEATITEPSILFSAPAHILLSPQHWPKRSFVLYQHIFGHGGSYPDDGYFYVGVTTRSWQARWAEHTRAINRGSPLLFHSKFREERAAKRMSYVHHKAMAVTTDVEALYATEQFVIEAHWTDERRLNMIPGGRYGMSYLRTHEIADDDDVILPDARDKLLATWLANNPGRTLPSHRQRRGKSDRQASVANPDRGRRLSEQQVRLIRKMGRADSTREIARRVDALNARQVRRVLAGETYARVT